MAGGTVVGHTGISGTIDARGAIQGINLEPCIIGKAIDMIVVVDILRLLQGILFKRRACLWDIHIAPYVLQREHFDALSEDTAYL
jgi:hypothetical protein